MFGYPIDSDYILNEPRTSRNFYHPSQYSRPSRPCSFYHNNVSNPFYNRPESFYYFAPQNYFDNDDDDDEQSLRERLMAYKQQQEEREREQQEEQLKRFFERKASEQQQQQQQQQRKSTFTNNNNDDDNQPKKSFKIKIQDDNNDDEKKSKAAIKIFNFIKKKSKNNQTSKILNKLYKLGKIENELKLIHETKNFEILKFKNDDDKKILPISIENKKFLEYEDKIIKVFDKLDGIQSEGADIIRERRKFIVKFAQSLLDELDNEKENQWKEFNKNSDVVKEEINVPVASENKENEEEINVPVASEEVITEVERLESTPATPPTTPIPSDDMDSVEPIQILLKETQEIEPENIEIDKVSDQDDEDLMDVSSQFETKVEPYTLTNRVDKEEFELVNEFPTSLTLSNDLVGQKEEENEFVFIESNDI